MEKDRIYFLDYLRVIACFMVMVVHASENFYLCAPEGAPSGETFRNFDSERNLVVYECGDHFYHLRAAVYDNLGLPALPYKRKHLVGKFL